MLNGKKAIVTGASRGIGRAIALKMAENGADVAIVYEKNSEAAMQVCQEARLFGIKAEIYQCDVADFNATEKVVSSIINDFGSIDILVNNSGIVKDRLILKMTEEEFDRVINVNLKGAFNMIKHTYPYFLKNGKGKIINITSLSGIVGNRGQANYSSAKAGLIGLTKAVAKEFAGKNITCNAVAPGGIETDMTQNLPEAIKEATIKSNPMKRYGTPEEVANAVLFFASDLAEYVTGEVIKVAGGAGM